MNQRRRPGRAISVAVGAWLLSAAGGQASAIDVPVEWTDNGNGHNWTVAENWNPNTMGGPANMGTLEFLVAIPGGFDPVNFDPLMPVSITNLDLGDDSRLILEPGTELTILGYAMLAGIIDGRGGDLTSQNAGFNGNRARVYATDGSRILIGASAYSSTGLWKSSYYGGTWDWTLFSASGPATQLDLSALENIDAGFTYESTHTESKNHQHIEVEGGAELKLSGVTSITGPGRRADSLQLAVSGADSLLDLSSLSVIAPASSGFTIFNVTGATLELQELRELNRVTFDVSNGQLDLPVIENLQDVRAYVTDEGTITASGAGTADYSSTGLWKSSYYGGTWDWTLFSASGPATQLDLSALENIDAGFAYESTHTESKNHQHIEVEGGAELKLSGVTSITGPGRRADSLQLAVSGADSLLDLSALTTVSSAGSGGIHFADSGTGSLLDMSSLATITCVDDAEVRVNVANGGHMLMGNVTISDLETTTSVTVTIDLHTDSLLTLGGLQTDCTHGADCLGAITLNTASDRMDIGGSLLLGNSITIVASLGGHIKIDGDLLYTHELTADFSLGNAVVECSGQSQRLEVGGTDYDLFWDLLPDDNFGFRQLVVGNAEADHTTVVELVDLHDNHQPSVADALILWGVMDNAEDGNTSMEGLRIEDGSTLAMGDTNVYALLDRNEDGVLDVNDRTRLRDLFEPCQDRLEYDGGFITRTPITLVESTPKHDETLWRLGNNHITMDFDCPNLVTPQPGEILIQEMLPDGEYGPDLSESFSMTIDDATLTLHEVEPVLSHGRWYAIRNAGDWIDVRKFTVPLLVQVGDATNDGFRAVLPNDLSLINTDIPNFSVPVDSRLDINGDGRVLPNDLSLCNQQIPSFDVEKPSGH